MLIQGFPGQEVPDTNSQNLALGIYESAPLPPFNVIPSPRVATQEICAVRHFGFCVSNFDSSRPLVVLLIESPPDNNSPYLTRSRSNLVQFSVPK